MEAVVNEKKNRRIAAASTVGLHVGLLVFFFFAVGWRPADPPLGELGGYEINFGLDDQGSGDIQPQTPVGTEQPESNPQTDPTVKPEEAKPEQKQSDPETKPDEQLTSKDESAVAVKDIKETKKDETVKPTETSKEKIDSKTTDQKTKEAEKPIAVYDPTAKKGADGKAGQPGSHGDDVNKKGDKGNPDGSLNAKALYGKPGGGGGGSSLSLDGWLWDEVPNPKAPSSEASGRVVFQIKVNSDGEIIDIKTIERSLSLEMENICRREIEKLTFSKTGNNLPSISTGKITFVVLSN